MNYYSKLNWHERLRIWGEGRGFELLSDRYTDSAFKYKWRCRTHGHIFDADKKNLSMDGCIQCRNLDKAHEIAEAHGGRLISTKWINGTTPLEFECEKGHRFPATRGRAKQFWCTICKPIKKSYPTHSIEEANLLAMERGGKCLDKKRFRDKDGMPFFRHLWECDKGHRWWAKYHSVKKGSWCNECRAEAQRLGIELFQQLAKEKNGRCLSTEYTHQKLELQYECFDCGNIWSSPARHILNGHWCPECGKIKLLKSHKKRKLNLETIQNVAEENNCICLNPGDYESISKSLCWKCKDCGHEWGTVIQYIRQNIITCPDCRRREKEKRKGEAPYRFAESKNGKCLGKAALADIPKRQRQYIGDTSYAWLCGAGHKWTAGFETAKRQWCYHCKIFKKIFQTVKSNNWVCLSRTYDGAKIPLELRCDKGHEFPMLKRKIESGCLCPICYPVDKKTQEGYAHEELCKETLIALGYEGYGITADKYELSIGNNGELCIPDFVLFGLERVWFDAKRSNFVESVHMTITKYTPHCDDLCMIYLRGKPRSPKGKARFLPITHFYKRLRKIQQFDLIQDIENLRKFGTIPDRFKSEIERMIKKENQLLLDNWV